jgi:hypothetical protein
MTHRQRGPHDGIFVRGRVEAHLREVAPIVAIRRIQLAPIANGESVQQAWPSLPPASL